MSAPTITIRTDVPLPPRPATVGPGRRSIYPFDKLENGHSFLVEFDDLATDEDKKKLRTRVSRAVTAANKSAKDNNTGKFFQARVGNNGVGVWRTK